MSKILQLVLPFWVMARKYGVMKMTVYDSRAITASLANGTFILNNQQ